MSTVAPLIAITAPITPPLVVQELSVVVGGISISQRGLLLERPKDRAHSAHENEPQNKL